MGDPEHTERAASTDELVDQLGAADRATRIAAAHELVARGEVRHALPVLDDPDLGVAMVVLRGLRGLTDQDLPPGVGEVLWRSRHRQAKLDALDRWSRTDPARADAAAREGLLSRSLYVRRRSQAILQFGGVDVAGCYRDLLPDGHDEPAHAMGELGRPDDVPALLVLLDSPRPRTRRRALESIARLLRKDAEPLLRSLLASPDPVLVRAADRQLARLRRWRPSLDVAWPPHSSDGPPGRWSACAPDADALRRVTDPYLGD